MQFRTHRPTPAPSARPCVAPVVHRADRVVVRVAEPAVASAPAPAQASSPLAEPAPTSAQPAAGTQPATNPRPAANNASRPRRASSARGLFVTEQSRVMPLALEIVQHPLLTASAVDTTSALRLVCQTPSAVPKALRAIAEANGRLQAADSPNRLQVRSSVFRPNGVPLYRTVASDSFKAFLFVALVPASTVPAADGATARITRGDTWTKASRYVQGRFETGTKALELSSIGTDGQINAFRALMLARYNILRAMKAPAQAADSQTEQPANPAPAPAPERQAYTLDFAYVPTSRTEQQPAGNELTVLSLNAYTCDPPAPSASKELRLATPRQSRAASPTRGGADEDDNSKYTRPRGRRAPRAPKVDGNQVTISAEEYRRMQESAKAAEVMKETVEQLKKNQDRLMDLLGTSMPQQKA